MTDPACRRQVVSAAGGGNFQPPRRRVESACARASEPAPIGGADRWSLVVGQTVILNRFLEGRFAAQPADQKNQPDAQDHQN